MNSNAVSFIKNFSYALTSNLLSVIVSVFIILIVPKFIGVEQYGYWQLYLFYSLYVGFFHFGWNDGIYLRYGGKEYNVLDKKLFFSQFYMLAILQFFIAGIIFVISIAIVADHNRTFILQMTALCMIIVNTRYMLLFILQATNRIKEYAQITVLDRLIYCCLIFVFLVFGIREFKVLITADLIGKLIALLYAMYCCKDIVFHNISSFYFSFREAIENIYVGIKLMFSNIASKLIIGSVRFGIEYSWSIATFGKVSLTLSVSGLMMLFINALGIILFPVLRRTDEKKLPSIYITMRDILMIVLLAVIIVYYPLKVFLSIWLPDYADSLIYMALLFPMCVYEGKMALLINTYLKTLRKEALMLKINLITLVISLIITLITTVLLKNLNLAVLSIVIILAFRCILAEIFLSQILEITVFKDVILELIMTFIFIFTAWYINSWLAALLYTMFYVMYLLIKRNGIKETVKTIKLLIKA